MNNWTHVKDFMPKESNRYLVARADGSVEIAELRLQAVENEPNFSWVSWVSIDSTRASIEDVTHWAPVPSHPAESK